jgi:plastocyanin
MRVRRLVGAVVIVTGCGGGGGGGGGTSPPVPVASVTTSPNSAQSTSVCGEVPFTAQARDAQQNILSRTITWTSTTTANVVVSPGTGAATTATGVAVGSSTVRATADGVSSTDVTVTVTAGGQPPATAGVDATASNQFTPGCVRLAAGGIVTWTFATTHNVNFNTSAPPGGNIPDQSSGTASRTFPNAGTYTYTCTLHQGMNGRVIVQ